MYVDEKAKGEVQLDEAGMLLLRAADLIERFGLAKHIQLDSNGAMCAAGAIVAAEGRQPSTWEKGDGYGPVGEVAVQRLLKHIGDGLEWGPAPWNNAPERTKEEVVAKLRVAALCTIELQKG